MDFDAVPCNPFRSEYILRDINMYLFFSVWISGVTLPRNVSEPLIFYEKETWRVYPVDERSQGIGSFSIDLVIPKYSVFITERVIHIILT